MPLRILMFTTLALLATFQSVRASESDSGPQRVVVHLSSFTEDLHRCFMALKVAGMMQENGAMVTIFLDLEGVRLAPRREKLDMTWGSNPTKLSEHYDKFVSAGGKIVLCPHCAQSSHIGDGGLKRNAEIGTPQSLGKMLMDADKVIDY
jgi:predicted peroxiredoxin